MGSISDVLFIIQFLVVIIILLVECYNIFSLGRFYDARACWVYFIGWVIAWFTGLVVVLNNPETLIYHSIYNFETALFVVNIFFLVIQLIMYAMNTATPGAAYNSLEHKQRQQDR